MIFFGLSLKKTPFFYKNNYQISVCCCVFGIQASPFAHAITSAIGFVPESASLPCLFSLRLRSFIIQHIIHHSALFGLHHLRHPSHH